MKNLQNSLTLAERITAPTPKLFQKIQLLGLVLTAVSGSLIGLQAQGTELPAWLEILSDRAALIGGIIAAVVSSLTVDLEAWKKKTALK